MEPPKDPILKNYLLKRLIGVGSFSFVWEALSLSTKEKVAIKIINKEIFIFQPKFEDYIRNAISYLPRIKHENVVKFIDFLETSQFLYIVLEYCNYGDLGKYLNQKQRIPEEEALEFLKQLICAFQVLNSEKIMHRDLKLENILLSKQDHSITIKLCDFDFLKKGEYGSTYCGTFLYMAPEILMLNRVYNNKTDLWSLGVVFYRMLCGRFPFLGENDSELVQVMEKVGVKFPNNLKLSELSVDFLRDVFKTNPEERVSWEEVYRRFAVEKKEKERFGTMSIISAKDYVKNEKVERTQNNGFCAFYRLCFSKAKFN